MCRHYPNSICGKDAQFYNDKLNTGTRFRLFLCQSTQADVAFIIHNKRGKVGIKAVAKACGLHFDRGRLGRILVSKFLQQVQYLEKKMAKAAATGKQLHFRCESSMPPILPGASALAAAPLGHPVVAPAMGISPQVGHQMHTIQQPAYSRTMQMSHNTNSDDLAQQFAKQLHFQH
ncbi:uncharacterized protein FFB20_00956 [Fusarium fujikuroi]|uniref:Uncharacterized protein n=1 Tax=Fusarium fujikuroi TaxID=5127 RepID=A0A2H3SP31_FUSFU|nr:uncharacterized protein Y057_7911 [Fusarium fujikuroi]QGI88320.1 hypothetical protein CEK25_003276 [Fusarium fujikuroi]SCN64739.1 uncharacterized protein FFB20_00956 [Fusarium fujikuroi]SCN70253.1 uncharacterized protein FFE2_01941 [Fusarium fujikuroi]SCO15167.1 uncharacterized protein FFC1_12394 [Fusarium fujikuroi]